MAGGGTCDTCVMALLRIPFASQRQRDLALELLARLDYQALDKSEPAGSGVRPEAGETLPGLRDGRRQIVLRGKYLPQWAGAVAASLAWRLGRKHPDTAWAQLFLDEDLLLVASTSQDVRGTRGLLEVDQRGKLLTWRDGGRKKAGPRMPVQNRAIDSLLTDLDTATQKPDRRRAKVAAEP